MTTHISGHRLHDVTLEALEIALTGDFRALKVTLWGQPGVLHDRTGIVTPHRDEIDELDQADLMAQLQALANDEFSDDGTYTHGHYSCRGLPPTVGDPAQWS